MDNVFFSPKNLQLIVDTHRFVENRTILVTKAYFQACMEVGRPIRREPAGCELIKITSSMVELALTYERYHCDFETVEFHLTTEEFLFSLNLVNVFKAVLMKEIKAAEELKAEADARVAADRKKIDMEIIERLKAKYPEEFK